MCRWAVGPPKFLGLHDGGIVRAPLFEVLAVGPANRRLPTKRPAGLGCSRALSKQPLIRSFLDDCPSLYKNWRAAIIEPALAQSGLVARRGKGRDQPALKIGDHDHAGLIGLLADSLTEFADDQQAGYAPWLAHLICQF